MTKIQTAIEAIIILAGGNTFKEHRDRNLETFFDGADENDKFTSYVSMQIDMIDEN